MAGLLIQSPGITAPAASPAGSNREMSAYVGLRVEFRHRSAKADRAFLDDIHALGDEAGESEILFADEKAEPLALHFSNGLDHLLDDAGREAFGRFVEQQQRGIAHQRARNREHLLFPARHARASASSQLTQVRKDGEELLWRPGGSVRARALPADQQIFLHRQIGEYPTVPRHVAKPAPHNLVSGALRNVLSVKYDRAAAPSHKPQDGAERRGLTRAVAANQRDRLAGGDLQRHVEQNLCSTESLAVLNYGLHRASQLRDKPPEPPR